MLTHIQHVAILTSDMEAAMAYYVDLLEIENPPEIVDVEKPDVSLRTVMLPIGHDGRTFLQIIEPSKGTGVEELARGGEGTIFEVGFEVDDIEAFQGRMMSKNIEPCDLAGHTINDKYIKSKYGNRYFILPKNKMRGTRTEIVQVCKTPCREN